MIKKKIALNCSNSEHFLVLLLQITAERFGVKEELTRSVNVFVMLRILSKAVFY